MRRLVLGLLGAVLVAGCGGPVKEAFFSPPYRRGSEIIVPVAGAVNADPYAAGKAAAQALGKRMFAEPRAILVTECFDGEARKKRALAGVCSVFPSAVVFGGATYGSFRQDGCFDRDAISLLGIGGEGISVAAALEQNLGTAGLSAEKDWAEIETRLRAAGARLAAKLSEQAHNRLLILFADAHSPKNAPLVEGVQQVMGKKFPITGGSVNKNQGQTYVYFQGRMFQDSAVAVLLAGDFEVCMAGRQAKDNDAVIATAKAAAAETRKYLKGTPFLALAFDCAGRKGKLNTLEEELQAIQGVVERTLPLFGCYCAGEVGPADTAEKKPDVLSSGVGWHIMFTLLGR